MKLKENSDLVFAGVDIEATSADLEAGGRICQIGVCLEPGSGFVSDIGWSDSYYTWEAKALEVNGFTLERIEAGPPPEDVDRELYVWLTDQGIQERRLVAVGFNVASFDAPFIKHALPRSWSLFARRSVDLNAVCFTYGSCKLYSGGAMLWSTWKRWAKRTANERLQAQYGVATHEHDALFDAQQALVAWQWLREQIS